jgi:peptidoglycan/xylan/chitin deacetylase (PgdA/CDA1 family)
VSKIFVIFYFLIVLFLTCTLERETTGPESPDGNQPDAAQIDPAKHDTTHYPAPDKLCALTFDDGPDTNLTNQVLDRLEYYMVPATFFVVGQKINGTTQSVLERQVSLNCEIGNHSYGYESMTAFTVAEIIESVSKTDSLIEEYAGITPHFFRPPNLAVNRRMYQNIDLPFASGILGYDWQGGDGDTPQKIVDYVLSGIEDGAIILLHDVQPLPHPTPEALDLLIPELRRQGYQFVTLRHLFIRKHIDPDVDNKMWVIVK